MSEWSVGGTTSYHCLENMVNCSDFTGYVSDFHISDDKSECENFTCTTSAELSDVAEEISRIRKAKKKKFIDCLTGMSTLESRTMYTEILRNAGEWVRMS